ncbi:MAG: M20/M25/M40 family metallo-hydrolase [Clostridia bacterium]|nr:M20/M25/M40 family metallo-hydrolase [Clostridia bacterium]
MKKSTKVILGASAAALAVGNAVHAALYTPKKHNYDDLPEEAVDLERYVAHLSEAIRHRTISNSDPEKTDWAAFDAFHAFLDEAFPLIAEKLEKEVIGRANLMYRWKGKNPDLLPIALLGHQDVVPVTPGTEDDWTHPAFDGYNDGAYIWGRGAMDMKNHLIGVMEAVETLLEEGYEPERDVYLLFGQDEEVVAAQYGGAKDMMLTLRDRGVRLESVLDEGGAILPIGIKGVLEKQLVGIGIAEKGYLDLEISLECKGGHSSQPPKHTGMGRMAQVIRDIESHQFPARIEPYLSELIYGIGRNTTYPVRLIACNLPALLPAVKQLFKQIPPAASFVRTTTAVTMAQGSPAPNVLPQTPKITVNFRMMPGTTTDDVVQHIKRVVRNKDIEVEVLRCKEASAFSPTDSRAFKIIEEICLQKDRNRIVAPFLVMGGTDACFYEPICENIYRFSPFVAPVSLLLCTHATDERVPIDCLRGGVEFFKSYVRKSAMAE